MRSWKDLRGECGMLEKVSGQYSRRHCLSSSVRQILVCKAYVILTHNWKDAWIIFIMFTLEKL